MLAKNKESQKRKIERDPVAYLISRAVRRGTEEVTITSDDVTMPTHCPCCGVFLKFGKPRENVPTLDRIDNQCGYAPGNVIVVCYRCNRAKGDLSIAELVQLASFYSKLTSRNVC